jgi:hypothetical protein
MRLNTTGARDLRHAWNPVLALYDIMPCHDAICKENHAEMWPERFLGDWSWFSAEAKTEESAILLLARNGHHIPRVIGPQVPGS